MHTQRLPIFLALLYVSCAPLLCTVIPLHQAVANEDIDVKDNAGWTPLHLAASWGKKETCDALIQQGADVRAKNHSGWSPLCLATSQHGANIHEKFQQGWTLLHIVASQGNKDICVFLIEHGADIHAKDEQGNTPLHLAAFLGCKSTTTFLLQQGTNIHLQNKQGQTPLTLAQNDDIKRIIIHYQAIQTSGYLTTTHDAPQAIIGLILTFSVGQECLSYLAR